MKWIPRGCRMRSWDNTLKALKTYSISPLLTLSDTILHEQTTFSESHVLYYFSSVRWWLVFDPDSNGLPCFYSLSSPCYYILSDITLSAAVILQGPLHLFTSRGHSPTVRSTLRSPRWSEPDQRFILWALITPPDTCSYQSWRAALYQSTASVKSVQRHSALFTLTVFISLCTLLKPMQKGSWWCFTLYLWL